MPSYMPARLVQSRVGRKVTTVTALRPIGELRRGRKDAISKRCLSPAPLPSPPTGRNRNLRRSADPGDNDTAGRLVRTGFFGRC